MRKMTLQLLLKTPVPEQTVPLHSKNWRKGNIIRMSALVVKRVINYAMINEEPDNGKTGYHKEIIKFQREPNALPCYQCRQPITIGSICYSKHRGRNTRSYSHMACAYQVNLLEEEVSLNGIPN
jgi:hypothetical protein